MSKTNPYAVQERPAPQIWKSPCCGRGAGYTCAEDCPRLASANRVEMRVAVLVAERMGGDVAQVLDAMNWDRSGWSGTNEAVRLMHELRPAVLKEFGACASHAWTGCPVCATKAVVAAGQSRMHPKRGPVDIVRVEPWGVVCTDAQGEHLSAVRGYADEWPLLPEKEPVRCIDAAAAASLLVGQRRTHPQLGSIELLGPGTLAAFGLWKYRRPDGLVGWADPSTCAKWPLAVPEALSIDGSALAAAREPIRKGVAVSFDRDGGLRAQVPTSLPPKNVCEPIPKSRRAVVPEAPTPAEVRAKNREVTARVAANPPEWAYPLAWTLAVGAVLEAYNNARDPVGFDERYWQKHVETSLRRYHDARLAGVLPERALAAGVGTSGDVDEMLRETYDAIACEAYERGRPGPGGVPGGALLRPSPRG